MAQLTDCVTHYLTACRARNVSPRTLEWYRQKLAVTLPLLAEVGVHETSDLSSLPLSLTITTLQQRAVSMRTVRGYVQVLKSFIHYLGEEELVNPALFQRIHPPAVPIRLTRTLDEATVNALFAATKLTRFPWLGERDRAILYTLLDTGVRASELVGLRERGLRLDDPGDPHLVVIGKGDKERGVGPLTYPAIRALRRYLRVRPEPVGPRRPGELSGDGFVFLSRLRRPLTVYGLDQLLYRLRDAAGLGAEEGLEIRAHTFRHTYAVTKLREGWDIKRLSLLLGHQSVTTTEVYLRDFQAAEARRPPPRSR